ncbi:hypothetical protein ACE6H2_013978 [Prunus campanulata]
MRQPLPSVIFSHLLTSIITQPRTTSSQPDRPSPRHHRSDPTRRQPLQEAPDSAGTSRRKSRQF